MPDKIIQLKKFGSILSGRGDGKTTFELLKKEVKALQASEFLIIDLTSVEVLNPSYADEAIVHLMEDHPEKIKLKGDISLAVRKSLESLERTKDIKILPK